MNVPDEVAFERAATQWAPLLERASTLRVTLLFHVAQQAMARGLSFAAFEHETGLPKGYVFALATGRRNPAHLSQDSVQAFAHFLDWPPIAVKAMAGQIGLADFYTETELTEQPERMATCLDAPALQDVPETVAVFAGVLACLDARKRKAIRDVCADGPVERH